MLDEEEKKLKLIIPLTSYRKLMAYVDLCTDEISGLADIEYDIENYAFVVGKIYLIDQEVSSANTEIDTDEAIHKFYNQLITKGVTQLPRLWWHSHADMGVFWSGTDEETMGSLKNDSYMIALETNHKHELLCRIMIWKPFVFVVDSIPVEIDFSYQRIPQYLAMEVKKKVKTKTWAYQKYDRGEIPQYTWTPKSKTSHYNSLPKDREKALARIENLKLVKFWNDEIGWAWENPENGDIWLDVHEVIMQDNLLRD